MPKESSSSRAYTDTIYRHKKRPDWGCAILLWDRGEKRGYQFEDGRKRVFNRNFCHMMKPVDRPVDETKNIRESLMTRVGRRVQPMFTAATNGIPLSAQIELLRDMFSDGFRDERWIKAKRGSGVGARLKRHRDPLIADARELLARDRLDELVDTGRHYDIVEAMRHLAGASDLTSKRQAQRLEAVRDRGVDELAVALRDVLYGSDEYALRFERFVALLARTTQSAPTWQLATLFSAAVHPSEHLFVRPKLTGLQAAWMTPRFTMTRQPSGPSYTRLRDMAMSLGERLGEAGLAPRDLLDLHDFMWETLRPKARKLIEEKRAVTRRA